MLPSVTALDHARHESRRQHRGSLSSRVLDHVRAVPDLPWPGAGQTRARWRALSTLGAESLPLAKVLEAHYDALAILSEAGEPAPPVGTLWAVWAAGGPDDTVTYDHRLGALSGTKPWCSADDVVTHALVTVTDGDKRPLAAVDLGAGSFELDAGQWHGPGMVGIPTGIGHFASAPARLVADADFYLQRPGFWHGGAGIAACWYGAATAIAEQVRRSSRIVGNPFAAVHVAVIDEQLHVARLALCELAAQIDDAPGTDHRYAVTRLRCLMDRVCRDVLERAALTLGPVSLCCDAEHAQRCADLAAFIRQCHAEKDEQWLGERLHACEHTPWAL